MPFLLNRSRWTQVPDVPAEIDWRHPLADGMEVGFVMGPAWFIELKRQMVCANALISPTVGVDGLGARGSADSSTSLLVPAAVVTHPTNALTVFARAVGYADAREKGFGTNGPSGSPQSWNFILQDNETLRLEMHDGGFFSAAAGSAVTAGQTYGFAGAWDAVSGVAQCYMDGYASGSATTGRTTNLTAGTQGVQVFNHNSGNAYYQDIIHCFYQWNRRLTADEILGLSKEPYALLKPRLVRQFYFAAAGGNVTLTADPGAVTTTGTAASLLKASKVAADAGSVAVTGTAASLEYNRLVSATAGSYAITGTDATLNKTILLNAEAGSVAVTGTDASLLRALTLTAAEGAILIAGTAANLTTTTESAVGGGWVPRHQDYRKGEREERGLEWKKRDRRAVRRSLERAYARMLGEEPATPEQAAERQVAAEIVKPFVSASHDTALPPREAVDWAALMRNADAARQLLALYSKERLDLDIRRRVAAILLLSV